MASPANRIVFLHGFLGSARDWEPIIDGCKSPIEKLAIDLQPADDWQSGIHSIIELIADGNKGSAANTILVGYSMGARIALGVSLECRLAGLVFVSGSPGIEDSIELSRRGIADRQMSERLEGMANPGIAKKMLPRFLDLWYRQPVFDSLNETQIADLVAWRSDMDCQRQSDLMRTFTIGNQPDFWPRLCELHANAKNSTPVLIVAGERDAKYVDISQRFVRANTSAHLAIVANAGHNVPREQPEKFCEILDDFACSRV